MSDLSLFAWTAWRIQTLRDAGSDAGRPLRPRSRPVARSAQAAALCREAS